MAEKEQPLALVLLRIVADGLRDPIRHVKYPDEERCARCGADWPCPNGAFDDLREEIKRLADLQAKLHEAREFLGEEQKALVRAEAKLQQAQAELLATEVPPGCSHRTKRRYRCYDCDRTFCKRCIKAHCKTARDEGLTGAAIERAGAIQAERDAAIEQNKRIMAWVCRFVEKRGSVVFTGLSVPRRELDEARAELATQGDELRADAASQRALAERGTKFLLLRIERVEAERNEAIQHEQDLRDSLGRILHPAEAHPQQEDD